MRKEPQSCSKLRPTLTSKSREVSTQPSGHDFDLRPARSVGSDAARKSPRRQGQLTIRELDVLRLMAAGLRNREIGAELSITQGTVKIHVHNILSKLDARTRTEAISKALLGRLL